MSQGVRSQKDPDGRRRTVESKSSTSLHSREKRPLPKEGEYSNIHLRDLYQKGSVYDGAKRKGYHDNHALLRTYLEVPMEMVAGAVGPLLSSLPSKIDSPETGTQAHSDTLPSLV